ncbi:MAG TPA: maleylacetoacetate isomerase [Steroidobacteraceae bacterium]|nr:maleylacetoacetate isomerase [Steroidobacteraceae bacterium]
MKLYTFWRSSAAYRARIALNFKGIAYESISRRLRQGEHRTGEYLGLNPQGLVPAIEEGNVVIAQSVAIIEYLEECYPSPPLLPKDPLGRAHVRSMAQNIACDIHPLNNLRVLNFLRDEMHLDKDAVDRWYAHWIEEGFRGLEVLAKRHAGDRKHCFGSQVTMADVFLVPQMYNARRFSCDVTPYPTLCGISAFLETLPPFAAARPEAQPDAE